MVSFNSGLNSPLQLLGTGRLPLKVQKKKKKKKKKNEKPWELGYVRNPVCEHFYLPLHLSIYIFLNFELLGS
jgi:hypothetical protein